VWLPPLFAVNGTPLVAAHGLPETIDGLLDGMAAAGALWRLPMLSIDGRIGRELTAACARRGFPVGAVGSFERAVLHRRAGYEAYARDRLSPNRRKGLRRRLKRLEAQGRVAFATFTEGEGLRQAVDAFLALEAAGWKGRRGTALAARDPGAPLTRALFSGPGACASSRADVLMLGGRPIAVSLSLLCGGTCFLLKTAYEEAFRGLAPGILLENAILRAFLDEGFAEKLDSASLPGSVLEGLFADRERMADVAIATGPAISPRALAALVPQERIRQAALARAKSWYWTVFDRSSAIRGR
jgi:CelD/BcsL family acetyltransferase involved in cellulose biosynthesis